MSELNMEVIQAGFGLPEQILLANGYKKFPKLAGINQIFIRE
jgi:hypothetical protein